MKNPTQEDELSAEKIEKQFSQENVRCCQPKGKILIWFSSVPVGVMLILVELAILNDMIENFRYDWKNAIAM